MLHCWEMQQRLLMIGSSLEVYYGITLEIFKTLSSKYNIEEVFTNHDYEPYALEREKIINDFLNTRNILFTTYKDQVVFEKNEVVKEDGKPYTVFTPYSRKWKSLLNDSHLKPYTTEKYFGNFYMQPAKEIPLLSFIGFKDTEKSFPSKSLNEELAKKYAAQRDFPAIDGTSRLGVHLRFGTISIRELASKAKTLSETFLNELIWRDFYQMILWHFPHIGHYKAFKPQV
jgi:deoxyribodipyrimidine photo-lyase